MPTTDRFVDFYELLGIDVMADAEAIRTAVKDKRRIWNPRQNHPEPKTRAHAEQTMRDLDGAERTLLDPGRRRSYDQQRPGRLAADAVDTPAGGEDNWEERARYFLDNDNVVAAHRVAVEAVTGTPGNSAAWTLRGQASGLLGNFSDAEYELAEAGRLAPDKSFPRYLLGEVYAAQEKWRSALNEYDRALTMDPDNPVYLTSKARLFLANDQPDMAVAIMEPIIDLYPDDEIYKFHLAMAYQDAAVTKLPEIPGSDGRHIWTSEEHIESLEDAADQIEVLDSRDPDVREAVSHLRSFAAEGRELHWDTAAPNFYVGLGFMLFGMSCGGWLSVGISPGVSFFLSLIVSGGIAFAIFAKFRHKPAWRLAKEAMGNGNLTQRFQRATVIATAGRFMQ